MTRQPRNASCLSPHVVLQFILAILLRFRVTIPGRVRNKVASYFTRKLHLIGVGMAILIVLAVGMLSYQDWRAYERNTSNAEQVRAAIEKAQQMLSLLKDAETGQRGYLLTGDEAYLAPFNESVPQIRQLNAEAAGRRGPFTDSAAAGRLAQLVTAKLTELARTIEVRRGGKDAALAIVRTNQGKQTMDEIRAATARLLGREQQQLGFREAAARGHENRTRIAIIVGTGALALLLLVAAIHLDRMFTALDLARRNEQHQRATLATTLRSIGDAVIATDASGTVTFANPVAESLTGWSARDAMHQPLPAVFRIVTEFTREKVDDPVTKVLQMGTTVGLANHTLLLARDGREVPIDDNGAPIKDENGGIAGVVLVFRDVTERRRAERQLEDSERRYRLLFENNPEPMWVLDVETLAFLAVNNAAVQRYGYSREEFGRMTLKDIRPADEIPTLQAEVRSSAGGHHTEGPWRHRKKDGTIITVELVGHPLDFGGRKARLVLASDITERKRLEEQFHQAQRLESVGRLAGGVAHDFNNLLTVINGYTEMLINDLPRESPIRDSLREVHAAGDRAAALTQQLLAFSRKQLIQPTVLNLNEVVADIQKMLGRLIGEDIHLVSNLAPDLSLVKADAGQLQQIIMNLAVNARDAMRGGGSLIVETANATFDNDYAAAHPEVRPGDYVMLAVTDTGSGMTPDVKARLFEPFFTTKPKGSGTGLGLATVYGMVKQSGGWIWVYTEPGHGTTFKVYLPRTGEPVARQRATVRTDLRGNETILIVEDQPEVRTLAATALQRFGYTVLDAADAEEALSIEGNCPGTIHLLLTDVVMPGMNGRELASRLAGRRPELRILFMSGYTENAIAHQGVLEGDVAFVQKPFTPDSLAEKVRHVLGPRPVSGTILVVDDDESVRRVLSNILTAAGFGVLEAANGRQALSYVGEHGELSLVLTDLVMPEHDGIELISELRKHRPSLKVIAMSGAFGGNILPVAKNLGAMATLRKPISRDDLLQAVRQVLACSDYEEPRPLSSPSQPGRAGRRTD
jgi:two-component system cell cycle sensor histidine kinase/response regulator CckA